MVREQGSDACRVDVSRFMHLAELRRLIAHSLKLHEDEHRIAMLRGNGSDLAGGLAGEASWAQTIEEAQLFGQRVTCIVVPTNVGMNSLCGQQVARMEVWSDSQRQAHKDQLALVSPMSSGKATSLQASKDHVVFSLPRSRKLNSTMVLDEPDAKRLKLVPRIPAAPQEHSVGTRRRLRRKTTPRELADAPQGCPSAALPQHIAPLANTNMSKLLADSSIVNGKIAEEVKTSEVQEPVSKSELHRRRRSSFLPRKLAELSLSPIDKIAKAKDFEAVVAWVPTPGRGRGRICGTNPDDERGRGHV